MFPLFFFLFLISRVEKLEAFLKDLEAGNLEPYLKSEPVPTDNSGPVTVAVAKNFDDVVTNNDKDTLIEVSICIRFSNVIDFSNSLSNILD